MIALAGYPLGCSVSSYGPEDESPCDVVTSRCKGEFSDHAALKAFARQCDVVTYEFENVPAAAAAAVSEVGKLLPGARALAVSQDRFTEKAFLRELGIPTADFATVDSDSDAEMAAKRLGFPLVLKTRTLGYDGKGQAVVRDATTLSDAVRSLGTTNLIAEAWIPFRRELSVIGVRSADGQCVVYPLFENTHRDGILSTTYFPARNVPAPLTEHASISITTLMAALDYVGVCTLELFDLGDTLLANEMAPRVHNSGHVTIEFAQCSQFENHLRAVAGMPLGSTQPRSDGVMHNIIGADAEYAALLKIPSASLHQYGKSPRPGRKIGHVSCAPSDSDRVASHLRNILVG
jgi:5-(carboxyamino)imidazole ribonucleotide synthase